MKSFFRTVLKYTKEADMLLLVLCLASTVYGIILISSATHGGDRSYIYIQVISTVLGIGLFVLFSLIDIDIIAGKSKILFVLSVLFILTLVLWGYDGGTGNKAWLRFGEIGIQPAEVVKIPFIIIIARMMSLYKERRELNKPLSILKIFAVFGFMFAVIVVISADLGSALVYLFILLAMLFIGGVSLLWFLAGAAVIAGISPILWNYFLRDDQKNRILAPFDPTIDPAGKEVKWQPNLSRQAIANGGFSGQGLYNGQLTQTRRVSQQHTDFIYSAAGEELGFIGCLLIILLLLGIIIRCVYVGIKSNNTLGLLVCTGFAAMFTFQMIENIGMCLGLTPVIGLTLPFFSYGGSSVITYFAAAGIVCGIKMRPKPIRFRSMY